MDPAWPQRLQTLPEGVRDHQRAEGRFWGIPWLQPRLLPSHIASIVLTRSHAVIQIDQVDQGLLISARKSEGGCIGAEHRCSLHGHGHCLSHAASRQHPTLLTVGPRHSPTGDRTQSYSSASTGCPQRGTRTSPKSSAPSPARARGSRESRQGFTARACSWQTGCRAGCRAGCGMQGGVRDAGGSGHTPAACTGQSRAARASCSLSGSEAPTRRLAQPQHQQPGSHQQELFWAGLDVCLKVLSSQNEACKGMRVHQCVVHPKIDMTLHQSAHKLCA